MFALLSNSNGVKLETDTELQNKKTQWQLQTIEMDRRRWLQEMELKTQKRPKNVFGY